MTQHPHSFLSGSSSYQVPVTPISQFTEAAGAYIPAERPTGRVVVQADGTVSIDARSARLLPAGDNTIDLRAPVKEGANWHLDCRAGGLCPRRPNGTSGGVRFRAKERVKGLLGCLPGPVEFLFEHVGNGLFRLYPLGGDKS